MRHPPVPRREDLVLVGPHAPARLGREAGELAGEILGHQPFGREPAAVEAFELSDLVGLQALGVAEDADGLPLPWMGDGPHWEDSRAWFPPRGLRHVSGVGGTNEGGYLARFAVEGVSPPSNVPKGE